MLLLDEGVRRMTGQQKVRPMIGSSNVIVQRFLAVFGLVALLGACEWLGLGDYCDELPKDSFCVDQENPTIFD